MKRLPAKLISCVLAAVLCLSVLSAEADYLTVIHSPESKSCASGETAQFMCAATGDGVTYRWQARSAADQAWTETSFAGHDGQILFVPAGNETDGWQFRCVISDAGGSSAATVPASLTVTAGKSAAVQPSAPAACASFDIMMACAVLLEPVPAITGIRPATFCTQNRITSRCSSSSSVGASPVVPTEMIASVPFVTWSSSRRSRLT